MTLTVPGVHEYYCMPHEVAGMVGRIVVGRPAGRGTRPFDYAWGIDDPRGAQSRRVAS